MEGLSARMKEDGQWIVLMGFMVSIGIFFLALILSQSTIVGQTTAEGVLEFPKNDVQDLRAQLLYITKEKSMSTSWTQAKEDKFQEDIQNLSLHRKSAIVAYDIGEWEGGDHRIVSIHYNNGVFEYYETANIRY